MPTALDKLLPSEYPWEKETLVRKVLKVETNPDWGCDPRKRKIQDLLYFGLIILDKPPNITSHEAAAWVSKILGVEPVGHGGTLDPKVSGVLPLALGKATPLATYWLKSDKEYICVMRLHREVPEEDILRILREFTGEIYQRPPIRSAVKRRTRIRKIYDIEFLERDDRDVLLRIKCQAGTYIRKLCVDIGDALGVGAHMIDLRRIRSGVFSEEYSVMMQEIMDAYILWKETGDDSELRRVILPIEVGALHMKRIIISDNTVGAITYGAQLYAPGVVAFDYDIKAGDAVALFTCKGELVAIAEVEVSGEDLLKMRSGQVTRKMRVIMPRGIYPPFWKGKFKDSSQTDSKT
ncbi:MAG: RNA-guided pseudouridylation complex pseudouridine synthase subunit Cbf5 [Candidatus Korarchaeota archaeon]|nr:RNA-guided pseudouridylation complex pseudouridine synthase subunit Cbf5 [Thermoproteota archaeon]